MPLFSIIIPVYNSEEYLVECLQSVLGQGFKNLEMILVDDGSTDKSGGICDFHGEKDERIRVVHHEKNRGVSAARNTGVGAARGDYVLFLDSDDRLSGDCLDGIAKGLGERGMPDLAVGRYITQRYSQRGEEGLSQDFTFDNAAIRSEDPDGVVAHIKDFSRLSPACWRYAIKRDFILANDLFFMNARVYEDAEYESRLLCLARTFAFYDGCLCWYRARSGSLAHSITHSKNDKNSASFLEVAMALCQFIHQNPLTDLKKEFLHIRIRGALKAFYGCLPMHTREEVREFAKIIESNAVSSEALANLPPDLGLSSAVQAYGAYNGLLSIAEAITNQTVSLVKGAAGKEVYVFCADLFGRAATQILRNHGYKVRGFLDNNTALEGSDLIGLKVSSPDILSRKPKGDLADVFVVVCQQRRNVFEKISCQLEGIGLKKEQIAHKVF